MPQRLGAGLECPPVCCPAAEARASRAVPLRAAPEFEGGGLGGRQLLGICRPGGAPPLPHRISDHLRTLPAGGDGVVTPHGAPRLSHTVRATKSGFITSHKDTMGQRVQCSPSCLHWPLPPPEWSRLLASMAMGRASDRDCGQGGVTGCRMARRRVLVDGSAYLGGGGAFLA